MRQDDFDWQGIDIWSIENMDPKEALRRLAAIAVDANQNGPGWVFSDALARRVSGALETESPVESVEASRQSWEAKYGRGTIQSFCHQLLLLGGCTNLAFTALKKSEDGNWVRDGGPTRYSERLQAEYVMVEAIYYGYAGNFVCPMMPWDEKSKILFYQLLKESESKTND